MLVARGKMIAEPGPLDPATLSQLASSIYQRRRDRDKFFDSALFADPAWDLLLAAYCLPKPGRLLSVSSLCYAAAVPPTTALRWLDRLCDLQFLERSPDASDHRVINVKLTTFGKEQIEKYLNFHAGRLRAQTLG